MSISLTDVRAQISDTARWFPAVAEAPDIVGVGDGANVTFQLRFPNYVASTLVVSLGTVPAQAPGSTAFVTQNASTYNVSATGLLTFTTAPAVGLLVATRYQCTAFSDAMLASYLVRAQAVQGDDRLTLKQVQFDLIDVLLGNPELLMVIRQGDYSRDPGRVFSALSKLKDDLRKDLTGDPRPGRSVPSIAIATQTRQRYEPRP